MNAVDAGQVVRDFFEANTRASRGERVDPLALCHDDLQWTMTGNTPVARRYVGLADFRDNVGRALLTQFRFGAEHGLYVREMVVEGNRVAVVVRGHGASAHGSQYNNHYFFMIEVRDGKLYRVVESCDGSLVWQSVYDRHLE